ncbi:succinate dehydrogenase assembly factor 3, mitochondrial [Aplysia californica]|uniref:Succinate dehydrogenase assembly factor 3 n=1 Tax=Aplysia californica TaxID=6500 RepID=A0ABM1VUD0_APLCA|nr:succinate dehydrogenase assembly factor 3, mitochondrial [Aplysia californica]XP_035826021.1 succinate dehydrogenase assembly factor 3, mitochondrial [Aplysia californica]XP_035826022.1 succinate dehydrogenase assembly factor 3, mitochondrial [Aplysia californica]
MASNITHTARVRALYKALLKLHRGLPVQMKALGDQYVKEEFRLHKEAKPEETEVFMQEWTKYYVTLAKQLGQRRHKQLVGNDLSPQMLDNLRPEQMGQLHELFVETTQTGRGDASNS